MLSSCRSQIFVSMPAELAEIGRLPIELGRKQRETFATFHFPFQETFKNFGASPPTAKQVGYRSTTKKN